MELKPELERPYQQLAEGFEDGRQGGGQKIRKNCQREERQEYGCIILLATTADNPDAQI
jgi:hypothetical protein